MWWYVVADAAETLCISNVGITIALVTNKHLAQNEQLTLVTCDVSRASVRSNHRVSIVVAVENECNNTPEDMNLCNIADRVPKWHKFVTMGERGQSLACTCIVYDAGSLVTSNLALKECKQPLEFSDWIRAAEERKRCRFVVCSFSPPMMSDDSFLVSFGWLQPLKSHKRLTIPWPLSTVEHVNICACPGANCRPTPETVVTTKRSVGSAQNILEFLRKYVVICSADTLDIQPLAKTRDFDFSDAQCAELTKTVLSESLYWAIR